MREYYNKILNNRQEKLLTNSVRTLLWSYDINKLDIKRDKEIIITQVLNYGTLKDVKWLFEVYGGDEIRNVILHPKRGQWWRKTLNYWTTVLNVKLQNKIFERAIIRISGENT